MSGISILLSAEDLGRIVGRPPGLVNTAPIVKNLAPESVIIPGVAGFRIFTDRLLLNAALAVNVTFRSGVAGVVLAQDVALLATILHDFSGMYTLADGDPLTLSASIAVAIRGLLVWRYV